MTTQIKRAWQCTRSQTGERLPRPPPHSSPLSLAMHIIAAPFVSCKLADCGSLLSHNSHVGALPNPFSALSATIRTKMKRYPKRAVHDRATIHAILDEVRVLADTHLSDQASPASYNVPLIPLDPALVRVARPSKRGQMSTDPSCYSRHRYARLSQWQSAPSTLALRTIVLQLCNCRRPWPCRCVVQGLVCHVGFVADGQQYVIPTAYARVGEVLYIHGSAVSRMLKTLAVCCCGD